MTELNSHDHRRLDRITEGDEWEALAKHLLRERMQTVHPDDLLDLLMLQWRETLITTDDETIKLAIVMARAFLHRFTDVLVEAGRDHR